jgi:hypothetical protein
MGHIWRARRKKTAAYFSNKQFGCPGGSFFLGFNKPQTETIIHYVSTGIPNWTAGERYCDSPDALRRIFEYLDPRPAPRKFCVVKPISQFSDVSSDACPLSGILSDHKDLENVSEKNPAKQKSLGGNFSP